MALEFGGDEEAEIAIELEEVVGFYHAPPDQWFNEHVIFVLRGGGEVPVTIDVAEPLIAKLRKGIYKRSESLIGPDSSI